MLHSRKTQYIHAQMHSNVYHTICCSYRWMKGHIVKWFILTIFSFLTVSQRICSVFSGAQAYSILENAVHKTMCLRTNFSFSTVSKIICSVFSGAQAYSILEKRSTYMRRCIAAARWASQRCLPVYCTVLQKPYNRAVSCMKIKLEVKTFFFSFYISEKINKTMI